MSLKIVMAQLTSTPDATENLQKARSTVKKARALYNADFVVFPEAFMSHFPKGTPPDIAIDSAQSLDGPFVTAMRELAGEHGVWLAFGMRESLADPKDRRIYNSVVLIDSSGNIVRVYRKTHLYDAFGMKESDRVKPGDQLFEPVDTPFGKIGILVCYELRFPEVARYQALKGAEILIVPSGWVRGDLKSEHWKTLVTARAIENTVFVVGCNHVSKDMYIGESLVVDPMGVTMACGNEREDLIPCYIDTDRIAEVRKKLPSIENRRPELY